MALLCDCEDGKRCAECARNEQTDAFKRNFHAEVDAMLRESDAMMAAEMRRYLTGRWDGGEASPPAPAGEASPSASDTSAPPEPHREEPPDDPAERR